MKVVTVATESNAGYKRFLDSCQYFDIPVENLGENVEYRGHGTKSVLLKRYLRQLPDDEVVLFTDAYDAVFLTDVDRILKAYSTFQHPFVISAEQNFSLKSHPLFFYWINFYYWLKYPEGPKPYRFLNSGGFIGEAGYILNLLESLQVSENTPSDQTLLSRYFITHPDAITLDYQQRIFSCNGGRCGLESQDYDLSDARLKNTVTGTYPCILHLPGLYDAGFSVLAPHLDYIPVSVLSDADRKKFDAKRRMNRFVAGTLRDNFLVKFIICNMICFVSLIIIGLSIHFLLIRMG